MTAPRLTSGQVVAGKYSIRAMLGFGGATATYTAVLAPGRDVVVKLFSPQLAQRSDVLGTLQQVAAVTNGLPDATGAILESGFDPQTGAPFMVTDLATVPSLAQTVEGGPLQAADVVLVLRGIARGVDAAHAQRLAHGGLKPQNVFVSPGPQRPVKVVDFGISVARAALPSNEGYAVAAPWMAPEQMQGTPGSAASDVFSAALVAFYAATGRSYWRSCQGPAPDVASWQQEVAAARVPPSARAQELGAQLNPAIDGALQRALSLNPAERFGSIAELADTLAKAGGAGAQKMAMTMPLNAMPQAAQDLLRQHAAGAAAQQQPPQQAFGGGGQTLAINSPLDAQWMAQQAQQAPMQQLQQPPTQPHAMQPMPMAMPQQQMPQQGMPQQQMPQQGMPQQQAGGYPSGPPPMMQAGAQPGYSMGPPPESAVVVPKSKGGLIIVLAIVGLLVVGGAVGGFLYLRHAPTLPDLTPSATAAGSTAPPGSTAAAATTAPESSTSAGGTAAAPTDTAAASASAAPATSDTGAAAAPAAEAGAPTTAELIVVCVPDCESVKIDDKLLDTTDAGVVPQDPVEVAVGAHTITVTKTSYLPQTKKVTLKAGQKAKETFYMTKPGAAPPIPKPCGKFLERCPN